MNEVLTKEAVKAKRRKQVETSLGGCVEVRSLGYATLLEISGSLLDVSALARDIKALRDAGEGPAALEAARPVTVLIEKVLLAGVVSPALGTDVAGGDLTVADFPPPDQIEIFYAILALSGFSKQAGEEVHP